MIDSTRSKKCTKNLTVTENYKSNGEDSMFEYILNMIKFKENETTLLKNYQNISGDII